MKPMQPMKPRRRFRPLSLLASLGLTFVVASGACSRNGEGERCDFDNGGSIGNTDCEDGLACISKEELRNSCDVGRCCPADENAPISDERCERGTPSCAVGTGGSGTDGGDGGDAAGAAGAAGLGGAAGQPGVDAGNDAADASVDAFDGQTDGAGTDAPADASSG
jgi:hypothetical protein